MKRLRLAVIFGGRSGEYEVSVVSARSVMKALDPKKFSILPIKIFKTGVWSRQLKKSEVDVAFPLVHGTFGEDGCLQGFLEILDIPYIGCNVLASSIGMDKVVQKQIFLHAGLPIVDHQWFMAYAWKKDPRDIVRRIEKSLGYPLFVKPANMGSSVGISRAGDRKALVAGVRLALKYDEKALVERAVSRAREIEVAILGNDDPRASVPGEIISSNEFYDYDAKYVDGASKSIIPAKLTEKQRRTIQEMAVKCFQAIDGKGMARVDFLISNRGQIFLNEINTIPGFTEISMFPKLWRASGLSYPRLLECLIFLALKRHAKRAGLFRSYRPKSGWWI